MPGITLEQAQARLELWLQAEEAVASGQSYSISVGSSSRSLTRANLREIREQIEFWERRVERLSRGGIRVQAVTPL